MRLIAYATLLISSISIINAQEIKYNQFDKNQKKLVNAILDAVYKSQ